MSVANLGVIAAAAGACGYALFQIGRAAAATRWPSTEGEIAGTRLVHRIDAGDGSTDYEYVSYRYEVAGRPYRNDRLRFGPLVAPSSIVPEADPPPNSPAAAEALARKYPRGTSVRVYYNPRRPADSVLSPTPAWSVWVILAAGVLFLYAAVRAPF